MKPYKGKLSIRCTKSDKCGKDDLHYRMKIIFLDWIDTQCGGINLIEYDKMALKSEVDDINYQPDATIFDGENFLWVEVETDPFNVFFKFAKLLYLENTKLQSWPHTIFFAITPLKQWDCFLQTYARLRKVLKIKKIFLCAIQEQKVTVLSDK